MTDSASGESSRASVSAAVNCSQLRFGRQVPLQREEAHFLVRRVLGEVADVVPAVDEDALLAVDRAQPAACDHNPFKSTFVGHLSPSNPSVHPVSTSTES